MRHCMVISSCPPFLAVIVLMVLGLLLLLEEVTVVPRSLITPGASVKLEIPEGGETSEIIYGKRISNIWKVEDFIVKKGILQQPKESKQPNFVVEKNLDIGRKSLVSKAGDPKTNVPDVHTFGRFGDPQNRTLNQTRGRGEVGRTTSSTQVSNRPVPHNESLVEIGMKDKPQTLVSRLPEQATTIEKVAEARKELKSSQQRQKQSQTNVKIPRGKDVQAKKGNKNLGDDNGYFVISNKRRSNLHDKIVNKFKLKAGEERDSFVNLHRYGYVLDSNACDRGNPKFAVLVHSKFNNFIKRAKIRNTFAKNKTVSGVRFAVTFVLGEPNMESLNLGDAVAEGKPESKKKEVEALKERKWKQAMDKLREESTVFNDIVMGNFTDSYRNLTIKHLLAYDWLIKRCKSPAFVLKVDDDILVNTYRIARLVKQAADTSDSKGLLICDVPESHKVIRGNNNKWFVSQQEYPFRFYPPWCKGYGVFMTRDVVKKLYVASSEIRDFWIDDVYVTGILAWRAGIQVRNFRQKHASVTHNKFEPNDIHAMFVWTRFTRKHSHRAYWKAMVAAQETRTHK